MKSNITRRDALKALGVTAAGLAVAPMLPAFAQEKKDEPTGAALLPNNPYPVVYEGPDVVIRKIKDHLWVGNGHLYSNETIYIYEGTERAVLIDTGTKMDNLDKIVASITSKPLTVLITHQHPDHSGSVKWFPEIWSSPGDQPYESEYMPDFKGKVNHFTNHQKFDLGGITLEVVFAPGHTPGSVLFIDEKNHFGFSGDEFGSGYLLMLTDHDTFINSSEAALDYLYEKKIYWLYPGHFVGTNADTTKRVYDFITIAKGVRDGSMKGNESAGLGGINRQVNYEGVFYNYVEK